MALNQPSKWELVNFEEAVEIWDSLRKPINSKERAQRISDKNQEELYPYYGATGQVGYIDSYLSDGEYVLLGEDGAPFLDPVANKAYLIQGKAWVNNHAHVLRSKYNNKFLCYYLNQFNYNGFVTGTTRYKLTQAAMKRIPIPVPSPDEQERIVSKIEELFSRLDASVAELQTAKEKLKVYRQTVLYKAFQNLTGTITMDEVADMIDPQPSHRTPPEVSNGVPYIGIGDIDYSARKVNFAEARKVSSLILQEHQERYTIHKGDFIMGKIGTIGKPFMIPLPQNYTLSANVILIQPNYTKILPEFLYWQFSSPLVTQQLTVGAAATSQPAFGIKKARLLSIRICDMEHQRQLTNEIEKSLSVCDSIEQTIDTSLHQAEALRQSILKQAFEGRL